MADSANSTSVVEGGEHLFRMSGNLCRCGGGGNRCDERPANLLALGVWRRSAGAGRALPCGIGQGLFYPRPRTGDAGVPNHYSGPTLDFPLDPPGTIEFRISFDKIGLDPDSAREIGVAFTAAFSAGPTPQARPAPSSCLIPRPGAQSTTYPATAEAATV